jgi:hypothetical protein
MRRDREFLLRMKAADGNSDASEDPEGAEDY